MICGLLLAAGAGSRFGADKLLAARVADRPLAVCSAGILRQALPTVWAVVADDHGPLAAWLRPLGFRLVTNPEPGRGLGSSIAAGVAATADADGWLIALADMPWLQPESIRAVMAVLEQGAPLAAPFYRGRRGHPVGFGRALRDQLLALEQEPGARGLLRCHADALVRVAVSDPGILADVDTPADLDRAAGGQAV